MYNEVSIAIPQNIENLQLPSPELLSYYKDIQRRVIWVDFEIDEGLMETVKQILRWNHEDRNVPKDQRKPIHMLIYSPDGDLEATFSCVDVMMMSETPIITINMGNALSGGMCLLLAGQKRYCLPSATAMLHSGSAVFGGTASQVSSVTQYYKVQLERMKKFVMSRTTIDARTYNKRKDEDWYFTAEDQIKYGIVDEIANSICNVIGGE